VTKYTPVTDNSKLEGWYRF